MCIMYLVIARESLTQHSVAMGNADFRLPVKTRRAWVCVCVK